jgi:chromosome segregation ATPase
MSPELRDRLFIAIPALIALLNKFRGQAVNLQASTVTQAALVATLNDQIIGLQTKSDSLSTALATAQTATAAAMENDKADQAEIEAQKVKVTELEAKLAELDAENNQNAIATASAKQAAEEAQVKLNSLTAEIEADDSKIKELIDTAQTAIDSKPEVQATPNE